MKIPNPIPALKIPPITLQELRNNDINSTEQIEIIC